MTDKFMQCALQLKNQKLFEMEELYQKYLEQYMPPFQENFHKTCVKIVQLQESGSLDPISYLEYTLLYTNLLQKKMTAEVRVYNDNWYLDSRQCIVGTFDFSYLFVKYQELQSELLACRKRFAGMVTAQEINAFLFSCTHAFYRYVAAVCYFSILPCVETEPFLSVQRTDKFEINIGEYMAYTSSIYKENRLHTSAKALEWFSLRRELEYAFEDFSCLDLSGEDLSEIDLRYSDLRHAKLAGTNLQDAILIGARFCHADMAGADLRYSRVHEADFTSANLTNARFTSAKAYAGVPSQAEWKITGYRKVCFRDANLNNADFRRTCIRDADFTGALMEGTLFDQKQLSQFHLSPKQRQTIRTENNEI